MGRPDADNIRRRIRAARLLAGMDRVDDLAEALDVRGLGRDTLYDIEGGKRPVRDHELRLIAQATGVAPAFFEVDFATIGQEDPTLEARVDKLEELVNDLLDEESAIEGFEADFAEGADSADAKRAQEGASTGRRRGVRPPRA